MTNNIVKGYRSMLGLTQIDLAKILGVTPQSISNKERGRTSFTDKEKIKIRELVKEVKPDITIDELFF